MAWVLRIGRASRWKGKDAEQAAKDLEPREGETGLSTFWVDAPEDGDRIGVLFGMYCRDKPKEVDYVLFPERCVARFRLVPRPDPNLPPELSKHHHEIEGMRDVDAASLLLARAVLADGATRVKHLREGDVLRLASTIVEEDPRHTGAVSEEWRQALAEWKTPSG